MENNRQPRRREARHRRSQEPSSRGLVDAANSASSATTPRSHLPTTGSSRPASLPQAEPTMAAGSNRSQPNEMSRLSPLNSRPESSRQGRGHPPISFQGTAPFTANNRPNPAALQTPAVAFAPTQAQNIRSFGQTTSRNPNNTAAHNLPSTSNGEPIQYSNFVLSLHHQNRQTQAALDQNQVDSFQLTGDHRLLQNDNHRLRNTRRHPENDVRESQHHNREQEPRPSQRGRANPNAHYHIWRLTTENGNLRRQVNNMSSTIDGLRSDLQDRTYTIRSLRGEAGHGPLSSMGGNVNDQATHMQPSYQGPSYGNNQRHGNVQGMQQERQSVHLQPPQSSQLDELAQPTEPTQTRATHNSPLSSPRDAIRTERRVVVRTTGLQGALSAIIISFTRQRAGIPAPTLPELLQLRSPGDILLATLEMNPANA